MIFNLKKIMNNSPTFLRNISEVHESDRLRSMKLQEMINF